MIETFDPSIFSGALADGRLGLATLDPQLTVTRRLGPLSDWLSAPGAPACDAPLLLNMSESLLALRAQGGELVLPSMRPAPESPRVTVSIFWDAAAGCFVVVTTPDHAGEQIDRLLASDRREKQLLQQQAAAAAARLRVADALYRDIVETSEDLVLRFGPDLRVVFANRAAAAFLGRPQDALVGARFPDLFPGAEAVSRAGAAPVACEIAARDAKGRAVWLALEARFLGPEAGGEFQAVARDVTAERRLRIARGKAQDETRAAAVAHERLCIAHDLHDTLARSIVALIAQARLVAKTTRDPETKTALAELDAQARQGLDEARAAIARTRAPRADDDLAAIVDAFAAQAPETSVIFEAAAAPPPEVAPLFAAVLRESLRNIDLHAGAAEARVALTRDAAGWRLVVCDNGVGFDPAAPTPGHFGVAGMRERAALAGAALVVESAPGKGTRIALIAPPKAAQVENLP